MGEDCCGEHQDGVMDGARRQAFDTMRARGMRVTNQRGALLDFLMSGHGPFSAEEVHRGIGGKGGDLVTVYRALAAFEELNLVRRCDFGDGVYRYEFNTGEHHHHHVVCRRCGRVETLDFCVADGLERIARRMGYTDVTHTLEVFGTCAACGGEVAREG
jgi:Fe2+ or Zn2+ uptake regulation protein